MTSGATSFPRVNSKQLASFRGKTVHVVGKVKTSSGTTAVIETGDQGIVNVNIKPGSEAAESGIYVDVRGIVEQDCSMKELVSMPLGPQFDLKAYDNALRVQHDDAELFYST